MPVEPFYSAGAISLANGATTFTLATGALEVNVKAGDELHVSGEAAVGIVASVTDDTEGELLFPWSGTSLVAEADYRFARRGPEWFSAVTITTQQSAILTRITAGGNLWETVGQPDADDGYAGDFAIEIQGLSATIYYKDPDTGWDAGTTLVGNGVTSGTGVPSGASGQDGDLYIRTSTGDLYLKTGGTWGIIAVITGGVGPMGPAAAPTWTYSTTTTEADPGDGLVRFNAANIESVTRIFIDSLGANGGTISPLVDTWDDYGTSTDRGMLFVFNPAAPTTWVQFRLRDSVEVFSGWRKLTVTKIASNPATGAFAANGVALAFMFIPAGAPGAAGATGLTPGKRFTFETAISGDPGSGRIRADNAAFASITALAIDDLDADGVNAEGWVQSLDNVDNADGKGRLVLQAIGSGASMEFNVTGAAADQTGYWTLAVTPIAGEVLADNLPIVAWFYPAGNDGAIGDEGPAAVPLGIVYAYDDATADSDPGDGNLRFNNADWALATAVYLDNESYAGVDVSAWIAGWSATGESIDRGRLLVMDVENPARFLIAQVIDSVVDGSGYRKVTIAVILAGATPSGDSPAAQVGVQFIPASAAALPPRLASAGGGVTDWDLAVDNGWYVGVDAANAPDTGTFIGTVTRDTAGTYVVQRLRKGGAEAADLLTWERSQITGAWGTWYRVRASEPELDARYLQLEDYDTFSSLVVTAQQFGVVGDGVTDDGPAIQSAIDTVPDGTRILFPNAYYKVGPTANGSNPDAVLTLPNGKRVSLAGEGFGSVFLVDQDTPDTMDVIRGELTTSTRGMTFENFAIQAEAFPAARNGIVFDFTGSDTVLVYQVIFRNLLIALKSETGVSIDVETADTSVSGGMAYSTIEECIIEGIRLANVGDNMKAEHNTLIPSHATQPFPVVYYCGIAGAHNFDAFFNVVAGLNTHFHIAGCWHAALGYNWCESPFGIDNQSVNNALIDLDGDVYECEHVSLIGNMLANHLDTGAPVPIRINNAYMAHVDGSHCWTYTDMNSIVLTSNAEDCVVGGGNTYEQAGGTRLYNKVSDSGVRTQFVDAGVRRDALTVTTTSFTVPAYMALVATLDLSASATRTVATISGHRKGQVITLEFNDSNITIVHGTNIKLDGGANFHGDNDATLTLESDGTVLHEIGRSGGLALDWTPTLTFAGGNTGLSVTASGTYTVHGKDVFIDATWTVATIGTASGNSQFGGLPFTAAANAQIGVEIQSAVSGVGDTMLSMFAVATATSLSLRKMVSGTMTTLTAADFQNGTVVRVNGRYRRS